MNVCAIQLYILISVRVKTRGVLTISVLYSEAGNPKKINIIKEQPKEVAEEGKAAKVL